MPAAMFSLVSSSSPAILTLLTSNIILLVFSCPRLGLCAPPNQIRRNIVYVYNVNSNQPASQISLNPESSITIKQSPKDNNQNGHIMGPAINDTSPGTILYRILIVGMYRRSAGKTPMQDDKIDHAPTTGKKSDWNVLIVKTKRPTKLGQDLVKEKVLARYLKGRNETVLQGKQQQQQSNNIKGVVVYAGKWKRKKFRNKKGGDYFKHRSNRNESQSNTDENGKGLRNSGWRFDVLSKGSIDTQKPLNRTKRFANIPDEYDDRYYDPNSRSGNRGNDVRRMRAQPTYYNLDDGDRYGFEYEKDYVNKYRNPIRTGIADDSYSTPEQSGQIGRQRKNPFDTFSESPDYRYSPNNQQLVQPDYGSYSYDSDYRYDPQTVISGTNLKDRFTTSFTDDENDASRYIEAPSINNYYSPENGVRLRGNDFRTYSNAQSQDTSANTFNTRHTGDGSTRRGEPDPYEVAFLGADANTDERQPSWINNVQDNSRVRYQTHYGHEDSFKTRGSIYPDADTQPSMSPMSASNSNPLYGDFYSSSNIPLKRGQKSRPRFEGNEFDKHSYSSKFDDRKNRPNALRHKYRDRYGGHYVNTDDINRQGYEVTGKDIHREMSHKNRYSLYKGDIGKTDYSNNDRSYFKDAVESDNIEGATDFNRQPVRYQSHASPSHGNRKRLDQSNNRLADRGYHDEHSTYDYNQYRDQHPRAVNSQPSFTNSRDIDRSGYKNQRTHTSNDYYRTPDVSDNAMYNNGEKRRSAHNDNYYDTLQPKRSHQVIFNGISLPRGYRFSRLFQKPSKKNNNEQSTKSKMSTDSGDKDTKYRRDNINPGMDPYENPTRFDTSNRYSITNDNNNNNNNNNEVYNRPSDVSNQWKSNMKQPKLNPWRSQDVGKRKSSAYKARYNRRLDRYSYDTDTTQPYRSVNKEVGRDKSGTKNRFYNQPTEESSRFSPSSSSTSSRDRYSSYRTRNNWRVKRQAIGAYPDVQYSDGTPYQYMPAGSQVYPQYVMVMEPPEGPSRQEAVYGIGSAHQEGAYPALPRQGLSYPTSAGNGNPNINMQTYTGPQLDYMQDPAGINHPYGEFQIKSPSYNNHRAQSPFLVEQLPNIDTYRQPFVQESYPMTSFHIPYRSNDVIRPSQNNRDTYGSEPTYPYSNQQKTIRFFMADKNFRSRRDSKNHRDFIRVPYNNNYNPNLYPHSEQPMTQHPHSQYSLHPPHDSYYSSPVHNQQFHSQPAYNNNNNNHNNQMIYLRSSEPQHLYNTYQRPSNQYYGDRQDYKEHMHPDHKSLQMRDYKIYPETTIPEMTQYASVNLRNHPDNLSVKTVKMPLHVEKVVPSYAAVQVESEPHHHVSRQSRVVPMHTYKQIKFYELPHATVTLKNQTAFIDPRSAGSYYGEQDNVQLVKIQSPPETQRQAKPVPYRTQIVKELKLVPYP